MSFARNVYALVWISHTFDYEDMIFLYRNPEIELSHIVRFIISTDLSESYAISNVYRVYDFIFFRTAHNIYRIVRTRGRDIAKSRVFWK